MLRVYASQAQWAIGIAFDTRPPELQHTCGMFVNTVLMGFEADEEESLKGMRDRWVRDLLPRARDPYHEVVRIVGGECNVMVACNIGMGFGDAPSVRRRSLGAEKGGARMESVDSDGEFNASAVSKFDSSFGFVDDSDGGWVINFNSGVGEWPRLGERLEHALRGLATAEGDTPAPPRLLGGEEVEMLEWGTGKAAVLPRECVHELVEAQAEGMPEAVALARGDGETIRYGEMWRRATVVGVELQVRGAGPDVLVGLMVERGFDLVIGMLGILGAGGAFVPIDPSYPEGRIRYVVEDSGVMRTMVTQRTHRRSDEDVCVDEMDFGAEAGVLRRGVGPSHLAYMIYTSGSTGRPKGVKVEHISIYNYVKWVSGQVGIGSSALCTSFTFDLTMTAIWTTLCYGAPLFIPTGKHVWDALKEMEGMNFEMLKIPPSLVPSVECVVSTIIVGGEALKHSVLDQIPPKVRVLDEYGPTECTVGCIAGYVDRTSQSASIGRPIENIVCYVVTTNEMYNVVSIGVSGELWIGGAGVARGYHSRPDLTAAKFTPNPFGQGRVYRSGDLVRWNRDAELEFVGRIDHQVKVRGFRIELGEVEAALQRIEGVRSAACVARNDVLVGYVAPTELDAMMLRSALSAVLPAYMVPSQVVALASLPLTTNGKLDRAALPDPLLEHSESYVAPRTSVEATLCTLWARVLDVGRVGVHDDFFALGGHSLLVIKLVNELRRGGFPTVSVRSILENTTVETQAWEISEDTYDAESEEVSSWDRASVPSTDGVDSLELIPSSVTSPEDETTIGGIIACCGRPQRLLEMDDDGVTRCVIA